LSVCPHTLERFSLNFIWGFSKKRFSRRPEIYKFFKNLSATEKFRHHKRDMNQVPLWKPTDISGHFTEFRFCGELATRSSSPLPKKRKNFQTIYIGTGIYLYLLL
jgi:hypothetical protein